MRRRKSQTAFLRSSCERNACAANVRRRATNEPRPHLLGCPRERNVDARCGSESYVDEPSRAPDPDLVFVLFATCNLVILGLFVIACVVFVGFAGVFPDVPIAAYSEKIGMVGLVLAAPGAIAGVVLFRLSRQLWTVTLGTLPFLVATLSATGGAISQADQINATRHVLTSPLTLFHHTIPAGSIVAHESAHDMLVTLPPGGTFDGEPIAGTFNVNDRSCRAALPFTMIHNLPSCVPPPSGIVNGVPCSSKLEATIVKPDDQHLPGFGVRCPLARTYKSHHIAWPAETVFDTAPPAVSYELADGLPGLLLFGAPLPPDTKFEFGKNDNHEPVLTLTTSAGTFVVHNCPVARLYIFHRPDPDPFADPSGRCPEMGDCRPNRDERAHARWQDRRLVNGNGDAYCGLPDVVTRGNAPTLRGRT